MNETPQKGRSKGCTVALIILGIAVLLIVISGIVCWQYKEDIVRFSIVKAVQDFQTQLQTNPPDEVDTVQFNALADAFVERLNTQENPDLERMTKFLQETQGLAGDSEIGADDVRLLEGAMIDFYPELESFRQESRMEDVEADTIDETESAFPE